MITGLRRVWERATKSPADKGLRFDRPLVLFQSDDWGRVGVRDCEGWDQLRASGIKLGEAPYDYYTLETAADVDALRAVLGKHEDLVGRHPSIGMNFIMANLDFDHCLDLGERELSVVPLNEGLPGHWQRPGLFDAYGLGLKEGLFFAGLHGLTHFCSKSILRELQAGGERAELVHTLWRAQTPYIHWRMPWIGYEYWDAALKPEDRFLSLAEQRSAIRRAADIYQTFFGAMPVSACAPGYRANADTRTAWFEAGVRVVQNGPGDRRAPYLDDAGMLHTFRTVEMEPATAAHELADLLMDVDGCFSSGIPAIVSIHSINFHSSLRDFCTPTLLLLDEFLKALEKKWPDVLYLDDASLFRVATEGFYLANGKKINVGLTNMAAKS